MKNISRLWTIGLLTIFLTGCTATSIWEHNNDLVSFYLAKKSSEGDVIALEGAMAGLQSVADTAIAAAGKANGDANKISLYRIAATAAWQGEYEAGIDGVGPGVQLCKNKEKAKLVPRDCGMLMVIPVFLATDMTTIRFDARNTASVAETGQALNAYISLAGTMLTRISKMPSEASPEFLAQVDDRATKLFTLTNKAFSAYNRIADGATSNAACTRVQALKQAAANLPATIAAGALMSAAISARTCDRA